MFRRAPLDVRQRCFETPAFKPYFHDKEVPTTYERLKMIFLAPLFLVRFLIVAFALAASWLLLRLIFLGWSPRSVQERDSYVRRRLSQIVGMAFSRLLTFAAGFHRFHIKGAEKIRWDEPFAIVANHASMLDPLILCSVFRQPSFVAKKSVAGIPFVGYNLFASRCFLLDRNKRKELVVDSGAKKGPVQTESVAAMVLKRQRENVSGERRPFSLMLFPEGTTSNLQYLFRFHTGAFIAGLPVRPVLMRYRYKHFSPAWETLGPLEYVYRLMTQFNNTVEIEVLDLYEPSAAERASPELYAYNVSRMFSERLGLPLVNQGLPEKIVLHRVLMGKSSYDTAMMDLAALDAARKPLLPQAAEAAGSGPASVSSQAAAPAA